MATLRLFTESDIPELVDLRGRCFGTSAHATPETLAQHFRRVFLDNPWPQEGFGSVVLEEDGRIVGFMGAIARPMLFRGQRIWAGVPTQLMVAPECRGKRYAQKIMGDFLNGPQDFTYTDLATGVVRRLWDSVGAETVIADSLYWTRPVRPARMALATLAGQGLPRAMAYLARPPAALADALLVRRKSSPFYVGGSNAVTVEDAEAAALIDAYQGLAERYALSPVYDEPALAWLLDCLAVGFGTEETLRCALARGDGGRPLAWSLYILRPNAEVKVMQLGGLERHVRNAVDGMVSDAYRHGCRAILGRAQAEYADVVASSPCHLDRSGPWVVVHSRHPDITAEIHRGNAWLTRLEGEWWMSF